MKAKLTILFKISLRNVLRRRLQTYSIGFMFFFTTFLIFIMTGFQSGSYKLMEDSYTKVFNGDFQIRNILYNDADEDFDKFVNSKDLSDIINILENYKKSKVYYSKRDIHFALAEANNRNYSFQLVGISPESEKNTSLVFKNIKEGSYLNKKDYNGILIGKDLASFLQVNIGQELTLMTTDIYDSFVIDVFNIVGIYQVGDEQIDKYSAFINNLYFNDNIIYDDNKFSNIVVKMENSSTRQELINEINTIKPENIKIVPWDEILPSIKQAIELDKISSIFFYIVVLIIIALIIVNSLLLSTTKRIPEFGILNALGMKIQDFKWLLLLENMIISTFSIMMGSILAMILIIYFSKVGIPIPSSAKEISSGTDFLLLDNMIYPNLYDSFLLLGPCLIYIFGILAIIPPIIKLEKSKPIEAIISN